MNSFHRNRPFISCIVEYDHSFSVQQSIRGNSFQRKTIVLLYLCYIYLTAVTLYLNLIELAHDCLRKSLCMLTYIMLSIRYGEFGLSRTSIAFNKYKSPTLVSTRNLCVLYEYCLRRGTLLGLLYINSKKSFGNMKSRYFYRFFLA